VDSARKPGVQAADRAEVDQPQPPVGEQQDVARMRVGVEDTVDDDLPQQAVEQVTGQPLAIAVNQRVRGGLAQRLPVEPLHDQHPPGAQVVVGPRDHYPVRAGGRAHRGEVPRLDPEVQFLTQRGGEPLGQLHHWSGPGPPGPRR
jgi:hypothetical protein